MDYKPQTPHRTYNNTYMHAFASGICDVQYKSQISMLFHDISRNIDFHKNPNIFPKTLSKITYVYQFSGPEVP